MIQIIPLEDSLVSDSLANLEHKDVFIVPLDTVSALLSRKLPIKNMRIALKNILEFLRYADRKIENANDTLVSFHFSELNMFFNMKQRTSYLELLRDLRIMSRVPQKDGSWYKPGDTSSLYRFHNEYHFGELCIAILDQPKKTVDIQTRVDKKFSNAIKLSEISYDLAVKAEVDYCRAKYKEEEVFRSKLRSRISRLFSAHANRYIKKGENVDRIFHSFSNVSRISREFLHISNQKYYSVDIVNCQPTLLCYFLKSKGLEIDENYINDCENGCLYENFVDIRGTFLDNDNGYYYKREKTLDRDSAKIELYKSIYFSFDEKNLVNQKFKELYPKTHKSLSSISNNIARELQNIEASIFNSLKPRKSKFFFTLFDEIYFTDEEDMKLLEKQLLSRFSKFSLTPKIKTK